LPADYGRNRQRAATLEQEKAAAESLPAAAFDETNNRERGDAGLPA
jgi:hypothetical protein